MSQRVLRRSGDLDVTEVARTKIRIFGSEARSIMLARAERYRRSRDIKSAEFWQAVADEVEVISGSRPTD